MKHGAIILMSAVAVLAVCAESPEPSAELAPAVAHDAAAVHWGYEGDEGPAHWADLSPEFALCEGGREQSPIDVGDATVTNRSLARVMGTTVLSVSQRARVMDLVDNGHTIQITNDVPIALDIDSVRYELVQYHFHAPSEHTFEGEHAPLEIHFVHKSADAQLAVAAVLVDEGEHDPILDPVIDALPSGLGDDRHIESLDLDPDEFQPLPEHYFRYKGSLTTPPCSEDVEWIVMAELRQASSDQLAAFTTRLHENNRPVQPLGDRVIEEIGVH